VVVAGGSMSLERLPRRMADASVFVSWRG